MWPCQPFLTSRNTAFIPQASRCGSLKYGFHPPCQAFWISKKRLPSSMPRVLGLQKTASILHARGFGSPKNSFQHLCQAFRISKQWLPSSMAKVLGFQKTVSVFQVRHCGFPKNGFHPPCQGFCISKETASIFHVCHAFGSPKNVLRLPGNPSKKKKKGVG